MIRIQDQRPPRSLGSATLLGVLACLAVSARLFGAPSLTGSPSTATLDPLIASFWTFDEEGDSVIDHGPLGRTSKVLGNAQRTQGVEGKALEFDGKTTWVEAGGPAFDFEKGDFTIDLWARMTNDGRFGVLVGKGAPQAHAANPGFELLLDSRPVDWAVGLAFAVSDGKNRRMVAVKKNPWCDGEWHRIVVTHAWAGSTALWVDGVRQGVSSVKLEPLIGTNAPLCLGRRFRGGEYFTGALDEVRLLSRALSDEEVGKACGPHASALNADPIFPPERALDGDLGDGASWKGFGAPNWLEISLPRAQRLARVILYPGFRAYAAYPSTEGSPARLRIDGYLDGEWKPVSKEWKVPAYQPGGKDPDHAGVIDIAPVALRRFRIQILELQDRGERVSGKTVAAGERGVFIREVRWLTEAEIAQGLTRGKSNLEGIDRELGVLRDRLKAGGAPASALRSAHCAELSNLESQARRLATGLDQDRIPALQRRLSELSTSLAPWTEAALAGQEIKVLGWQGAGGAGLVVELAAAGQAKLPVSLPLDLEVLERCWGTFLGSWDIQVHALDDATGACVPYESAAGKIVLQRCPSRFDRTAPKKGVLKWLLAGKGGRRYLIVPGPKTALPPVAGQFTLGDGDRIYYDKEEKVAIPWNTTSSIFIDWDRDGAPDLLTGAWTDYAHLWRNLGTASRPLYSDREHWLLSDREGTPLLANPDHPGLGFSFIMAVDVDRDGLADLFVNSVMYGGVPAFYRNLGPASFPELSPPRPVVGLERGRPSFGDLDGDGFIDAVVATSRKGETVLVFQKGSLDKEKTPVFSNAVVLEAGGRPLAFASSLSAPPKPYCVPCLFDVDGDGDLDLTYYVAAGFVHYAENTGSPAALRFAEPRKVEAGGKPLDLGTYYHSAIWSDADGDGLPDLVCNTGCRVYRNVGTRRAFRLESTATKLGYTGQVLLGPHRLQGYAFADWNGDGAMDRFMTRQENLDLEVELSLGGWFRSNFIVSMDPNKDDWFGCPDPGEYRSLYSGTKMVDIDGDGDLDLFAVTEHSWRFGYIHFYENLGGGRFGPEQEFRPGAACDFVAFVPGKVGKAIQVDTNTVLDYLSYPTAGNFDPAGGRISFWFKPNWDASDTHRHVLFSTEKNPNLSLDMRAVHRYYMKNPDVPPLPPGFELLRTEKGALCLQRWQHRTESAPFPWVKGTWVRIEASWGPKGASLMVDGKKVAEDAATVAVGEVGRRIFLGSHPVLYVQHSREEPSRFSQHPIDWIASADGAFDEFEISMGDGKSLLALPFEGNCDGRDGEVGSRLRAGYRCTPDFADLNGDGLVDMVMVVSDGHRGHNVPNRVSELGRGVLTFFPNLGAKGKPRFGAGVPLTREGDVFRVHPRTQVTLVDWDLDGDVDLFLSTENTTMRAEDLYNQGYDYFPNEGTKSAPRFGKRVRQQAIIDRIQPWHDNKLAAVDFDGDGRPDLVASADNGSFFFSHVFMNEKAPEVRILGTALKVK